MVPAREAESMDSRRAVPERAMSGDRADRAALPAS
jgi:hypothetical protein